MARSLIRLGRDALALTLATLIFWAPALAPVAQAQEEESAPTASAEASAPLDVDLREYDLERPVTAPGVAESAGIDREAVRDAVRERLEETEAAPVDATPISLPGGETRSAVSAQAISLPNAEGSIEGMGESFAPVLSSGTATFTVPIAVAPGRAGVQPSLSLSYSSSGGNGPIGFGWGMGVPFISRQTDRGLPRYRDRASYHAEEDRFIYNGGQELVPVDTAAMAVIDQTASPEGDSAAEVPADVVGWQQYRARVEGGFMRFFRAPPSASGRISSWVVQSKDGTRFDFGLLPAGEGPSELAGNGALSSLEADSEGGTHVFRWMLTRMSDAHGSTVYYSYRADQGQLYLSDIHYLSPASCASSEPDHVRGCTDSLATFGAHVRLIYESRDDAFSTYTSGWRVVTGLRLRRVEVTAYDDTTGARTLVRRYHLRYRANSYHSLLESVQVEGRPHAMREDVGVEVGDATIPESSLTDRVIGPLLPPMTFGYSSLPDAAGAIAGFGALANDVHTLSSSPPSSIDEARSDFFDVNSDGLPDYIVTDPARYRTRDGQPAVGVFFNGFSGSDARPGVAGEFSDAVPMGMRSDLSGVLSLSNLNIVPMDMDGDGRTDLLHMPRARSYGWFTPTRAADVEGRPAAVSPADQGWRWSYAAIDLPASDTDPRIDFGRDGEHFQTVDVNNDHLIDVVRTTGTVMQTWLNLGWVPVRDAAGRPAGDGRFGSARYDGSTWRLSTEPVESCLLQAGTPLDFEDSESRLADMNGDGLVDLVRVRRGRVIWWPGRGLDSTGAVSWGDGPRDCARGEGASRYVEMQTPPAELNVDLAGVQLADIDGDGASDIVQVRFDAIDVWFNRAGQSFTSRFVVRSTPAAPDFAPRVRVMDIDGSGTVDVVYANGGRWQYVDLLQRTQPRMLVSVDNGLGALTTIGYDTSARDYLEDLAAARTECRDESSGCDRFVWSRVDGEPSQRLQRRAAGEPTASLYHSGGSPVVSTVVRSIRTSDRFGIYSADQVSETRFGYHEGYYEGIEQEFRGFGAADSITVGDATNPSVLTRTWFQQGRRAQDIADDRLEWNPDEALKGREFLTEVLDENGHYLSSAHATLTSRTLATGLDGRPIQYAYVSQADELRYDTTDYEALGATVTLPDVVREDVSATGVISTPAIDRDRTVFVRGARAVMIETTYDEVDNLGQVHEQTAHGRVAVPGTVLPTDDPPITSVTTPVLVNGSAWVWRTQSSYVLGSLTGEVGTTHLGETTNRYSEAGDLLSTTQVVTSPRTYEFDGDPSGEGGAEALTQTDDALVASSVVDTWGQSRFSCLGSDVGTAETVGFEFFEPRPGCLRYGLVGRDEWYEQLVTVEAAWTGASTYLISQGVWDRGLGVLVSATDPSSLETTVTYDGLGRMTSVTPPSAEGCSTPTPTTRIRYELTTAPASQPVSRVVTTTELDCDGTLGEANTDGHGSLVSIGYVDGLGRVRATLATGGEEAPWVRAGLTQLDAKGAVHLAWQPDFFSASDTGLSAVLALPPDSLPHTRTIYDAFGRVRVAFAEDCSMTTTSYHTLSTDVCDPLDNDVGDATNFGTCTTARTDGHGRLIDQVLRYRADGMSATEHHRLWTYYRNDGAVIGLVRAEEPDSTLRPTFAAAASSTSYPHVQRTFVYDSVGRRIGSDDPDTDDLSNGDPRSRTWRYLFNRAGDLTAVRDPRGCGQNFYYDLGGRLLGEQYVGCGEAQAAVLELPTEELGESVGMDLIDSPRVVDVRYFYDALPGWVGETTLDVEPEPGAPLVGRATGVADRAQRAAVSYDQRGNAVWTARQVAVISEELALSTTLSGDYPVVTETVPGVGGNVLYDDEHTYVRTASFDHAGRPVSMALPRDPDWDSIDTPPLVQGFLEHDSRGLPGSADLVVGEGMSATTVHVVRAIHYLRDGLVDSIEYGELSSNPVVESTTEYDARRRPTRMAATRTPTGMSGLRGVSAIADQNLVWDAASNLTEIRDNRDAADWPAGYRPASVSITHDSLYRVVSALFDYATVEEETVGEDEGTDWRSNATASEAVDPMRPHAAPMVSSTPPSRVQNLTWNWDWLGNMTEWTDDAQQFYERSIGDITNGVNVGERPSALYLASNVDVSSPHDRGWVELDYGVGGNVTSVTVHAQCEDAPSETCADPGGDDLEVRRDALRETCTCAVQQHFVYRWDELDRISEALRFDRASTGDWTAEARQRYRYDGANVRVIKESFEVDEEDASTESTRVALYVYPGDFERRGLERGFGTYVPASSGTETETQYVVAGARMVWDHDPTTGFDFVDPNRRVTIPVSDLLHTTAATVDLMSGELLEVSTYYPNGARETLLVNDDLLDPDALTPVPLEPTGFTGKEADEDVGLVYFGERYLLARLGRWASPDPLHVHANGGGEALNSFHYVAGNTLQTRDQIGLCGDDGEGPCQGTMNGGDAGDWSRHAEDARTSRASRTAFSVGVQVGAIDEDIAAANAAGIRGVLPVVTADGTASVALRELSFRMAEYEEAGYVSQDELGYHHSSTLDARIAQMSDDVRPAYERGLAASFSVREREARWQTGSFLMSMAFSMLLGGPGDTSAMFARGTELAPLQITLTWVRGTSFFDYSRISETLAWARTSARRLAGSSGCVEAARQIQSRIGGELVELVPRGDARRLGGIREGDDVVFMGWDDHTVVRRDGMIYDMLTGPEGMTEEAYMGMWVDGAAIDLRPVR